MHAEAHAHNAHLRIDICIVRNIYSPFCFLLNET